jgi:death-on-curing protein
VTADEEHRIEYLTLEEVILLHSRLIQRTGGAGGARDLGLLESAVAPPRASFGGEDLYPDLWSKAAALMHSLIHNHPFVDGNKRTAITAMGIFLELNGHEFAANNEAALTFTRRVLKEKMELEEMAAWVRAHVAEGQAAE